MHHYLFGYGSLISRESRSRTAKTGEAVPVQVHGIQRAWNVIAPEMKMAGVGIVVQDSASCNGVLVEINESEIPAFDKRELEGTNYNYERLEIPTSKITCEAVKLSNEIKVWGYMVKRPSTPSEEFPIAQSYVDVITTGCLEFSEEFAAEFIRSTVGWEYSWDNDRSQPRYLRPLKTLEFQERIDVLLAEYAPLAFAKRRNVADINP